MRIPHIVSERQLVLFKQTNPRHRKYFDFFSRNLDCTRAFEEYKIRTGPGKERICMVFSNQYRFDRKPPARSRFRKNFHNFSYSQRSRNKKYGLDRVLEVKFGCKNSFLLETEKICPKTRISSGIYRTLHVFYRKNAYIGTCIRNLLSKFKR